MYQFLQCIAAYCSVLQCVAANAAIATKKKLFLTFACISFHPTFSTHACFNTNIYTHKYVGVRAEEKQG